MSRLRSRMTFANVVAVIALFVALGGSATAAVLITGKQVKNSSLTGRDVRNNSLGSADVKDGNLLAKDFKAGQLPAGAQGHAGPEGPAGPTGPAGPQGVQGIPGSDAFGAITYVRGPATALAANESTTAEPVALCPAGQVPLGGGVQNGASPAGADDTSYYLLIAYSHPHIGANGRPDGWVTGVTHRPGTALAYSLRAWVACAAAGQVTGP